MKMLTNSMNSKVASSVATPVAAVAMPLSTLRAQTRPRINWADSAKGLSIILVVVFHVVRGLNSAHIMATSYVYDIVNMILIRIRMPLFFFTSGLFIERIVKRDPKRFFLNRAGTLLYPYFVWSVIQTAFQSRFSVYANHKIDFWPTVLMLPYEAPMQFWFLYVLFVGSSLWYLLRKLRVPIWAATLGALVLYLTANQVNWSWWHHAVEVRDLLPFLALGALASDWLLTRKRPSTLALITTFLGGMALLVGTVVAFPDNQWRALALLGSIAGISGIVCLCMLMSDMRLARSVKLCGRYSLQIFVLHTMVAAVCRAILTQGLNVRSPSLHVLCGVLVGLALPIFVADVANRAGAEWVFRIRSNTRTTARPTIDSSTT